MDNEHKDQPRNWQQLVAQLLVPQADNTYSGVFASNDDWFKVTKNGGVFDHGPSLKIHNHSPDGFAWGYAGSGPAQLALAILFEETGNPVVAQHFYMDYKWEVVSKLSKEEGKVWTLTSSDIRRWLREKSEVNDG